MPSPCCLGCRHKRLAAVRMIRVAFQKIATREAREHNFPVGHVCTVPAAVFLLKAVGLGRLGGV